MSSDLALPTVHVPVAEGDWLPPALDQITRRVLPALLPSQRWFGDKAASIEQATVQSYAVVDREEERFALPIVALRLQGRPNPVAYAVPIVFSPHPPSAAGQALALVEADGRAWWATDAAASPAFRAWLFGEMVAGTRLHATAGVFEWRPTDQLEQFSAVAGGGVSRLIRTEQSNSSIVYGQAVMLKLFRKLQPGINPDVELGRFLTTRTSFRHMPLVLADWQYTARDGTAWSTGVAQNFVPNIGDGWTDLLARLRGLTGPDRRRPEPLAADAALLGRRTAQLHLALASNRDDPAVAPEPITREDTEAWTARFQSSLDEISGALRAEVGQRRAAGSLVEAFLTSVPTLRSRATGFEKLIGAAKTRVHGDYHLGQTLRTVDDDYVILDFEGEPQRPIAERRRKTSPLKDVAGMLRSFGYARGAAAQEAGEEAVEVSADLVTWERTARRRFLDAYLDECRADGATFLPEADEDVREALAAWELDKAIYEVGYELNNRPDWLWLPLSGILKYA